MLSLKPIVAAAVLALAALAPQAALADDGDPAVIRGEAIDVDYIDHAFSGRIKDTLVFALPLEDTYGVELTLRGVGYVKKTTFKEDAAGDLVGTLGERTFKFVKIDHATSVMHWLVDGKEVTVKLAAEDSVDGHFVDPAFTIVHDGKESGFKLEGGKACWGCAVKISFVVLAALFQ